MGLTFCQTVTLKLADVSYLGLDGRPKPTIRFHSLPSLTGERHSQKAIRGLHGARTRTPHRDKVVLYR